MATVRFKVKAVLCPSIIDKVFDFCENRECKFGSQSKLKQLKINTTQFGTESTNNVGKKIWD